MPDTFDWGTALDRLFKFLGDYGLGITVLVLLVGGLVYALILSGRNKNGVRQTPILIPGSELDAFREQAKLTEERIRQDAASLVGTSEKLRIEERTRREESDAKLDKALDLLERVTDQLMELRLDVARSQPRRRNRTDDDKTS